MAQPIKLMKRDQSNLWYEESAAAELSLPSETVNAMQIVETLPQKYRKRAISLITRLGNALKINGDGKVVFADTNTVSDSHFRDFILWYLDRKKYAKPYDADQFVGLIPVQKWKSLY